jgi:PAS domain S-box-containing protein
MSMDASSLTDTLKVFHGRLRELMRQLDQTQAVPVGLAQQIVGELETTIEELHVLEEELFQKDHALTEAIATVEAERERYLDLFHGAPDPYIVTNSSAVVQQANQAAQTFLQVPPQYLIGKPLTIFVPEAEHRLLFEKVYQLNQNHGSIPARADWQTHLVPRGGKPVPVQVRCSSVQSQGGGSDIRWIFHDLTAVKQAELSEELAKLNAALQEKISELERFEDVVVGREIKMLSLEKENQRLQDRLKKLGRPPDAS